MIKFVVMQHIKVCLLFFAFFLFFSCVKPLKERSLTMQDVFPKQKNTGFTFVFSLDTIKSFDKIVNVFCENYGDEKIKYFIKTDKNFVNFDINSPILCNRAICGKIRFRNVLFIEHSLDTVFIHSNKVYTLNSVEFENMLKKQFLNNGEKPEFAENAYKNLIHLNFISEKELKDCNLNRKLDTITKSYFNFIKSFKKQNIDSLKRRYPLNIRLQEVILIDKPEIIKIK